MHGELGPAREKKESPPLETASAISRRIERMLPADLDASSMPAVKRLLWLCLCILPPEALAMEDLDDLVRVAAKTIGFNEALPQLDLRGGGGIAAGLAAILPEGPLGRLQEEMRSRVAADERMDKVFALLCMQG